MSVKTEETAIFSPVICEVKKEVIVRCFFLRTHLRPMCAVLVLPKGPIQIAWEEEVGYKRRKGTAQAITPSDIFVVPRK